MLPSVLFRSIATLSQGFLCNAMVTLEFFIGNQFISNLSVYCLLYASRELQFASLAISS